jgi:hypothetical protein
MKTQIALFDAHSFDKELVDYRLNSEDCSFQYILYKSGDKPVGADLVFISDELTQTRLPHFFPRRKRVAWLKESPVHTRNIDAVDLSRNFDVVLTHRKDLIELGPPFFRVDFSANWVYSSKEIPTHNSKNKLVSFIGSIEHLQQHGYVLRQDVATMLLKRGEIDCFGKGINPIESKLDALRDYRFSVAMENTREDYYYTEKLIDCFLTETVPIYWGCPSIHEVFDSRGMITFESLSELESILDSLSEDQYNDLLPYAQENKRRCKELRLSDYDGYLERCVETAIANIGDASRPVNRWQLSKAMAGLRSLGLDKLGL